MNSTRPTVLIFNVPGSPNNANFLSGVMHYAKNRRWRTIIVSSWSKDSIRPLLRLVGPIGCVVSCGREDHPDHPLPNPTVFKNVPVVYFYDNITRFSTPVSSVRLDDDSVGRLAARKLSELTPASFGYIPWKSRERWCTERRKAFCRELAESGHEVRIFSCKSRDISVHVGKFKDYLKSLPKPCALFAANDAVAWNAVLAAEDIGIRIPGDMALLGVDNVEYICNNAKPTISSIAIDFAYGGQMAAELLDDLIAGRVKAPTERRFRPLTVVSRESTRSAPARGPDIAKAISLITERACEGLRAGEVAKVLGVSRRQSERRFRAATGKTILEAINAVRIAKAKRLLRGRTTDISAIADLCGWSSPDYLRKVFRRETGMSPTEWQHSANAV